MKNFFTQKNKSGYTIIETMIAVSLFIIIVSMGMGALLNANVLDNKSQNMRSIMDNMSFAMEDMSRNLRTGYNYHCINDGIFTNLSVPKSCPNKGGAIAFEPSDGNPITPDQWVYKIESSDGGITFNIFKSVDSGTNWIQLNPSEVVINSFSGFTVFGAEPSSSGDVQQPFVKIQLVGTITYQKVVTPFYLQTSVSQRKIDNM